MRRGAYRALSELLLAPVFSVGGADGVGRDLVLLLGGGERDEGAGGEGGDGEGLHGGWRMWVACCVRDAGM